MVIEPAANFAVAAGGRDGKLSCGQGLNFQKHRKRESRSVKRRSQIGGSSGKHEFQWRAFAKLFRCGFHSLGKSTIRKTYFRGSFCSAYSSTFTTAFALASSTIGAR